MNIKEADVSQATKVSIALGRIGNAILNLRNGWLFAAETTDASNEDFSIGSFVTAKSN